MDYILENRLKAYEVVDIISKKKSESGENIRLNIEKIEVKKRNPSNDEIVSIGLLRIASNLSNLKIKKLIKDYAVYPSTFFSILNKYEKTIESFFKEIVKEQKLGDFSSLKNDSVKLIVLNEDEEFGNIDEEALIKAICSKTQDLKIFEKSKIKTESLISLFDLVQYWKENFAYNINFKDFVKVLKNIIINGLEEPIIKQQVVIEEEVFFVVNPMIIEEGKKREEEEEDE